MRLLGPLLVGTSLLMVAAAGATSGQQTSTQAADGNDPCAVYGEGYQRIPGTDTCVKVSGYIQATGGTSNGQSGSGK